MRNLSLAAIILAGLLAVAGCSKGDLSSNCQLLRTGISNSDKEKVKNAISHFISQLPSKGHTPENLQKLTDAISRECNATAKVLCFACIKTLPEQSEISVDYLGADHGIIDISIDREGRMVFSNLHE
jgi:hypothetical protein